MAHFKTNYMQDIRLFRNAQATVTYGLLLAVLTVLPFLLSEFYIDQVSFVLIYSIGGIGMMLLVGYTGLVSLGQSALMGIGAYTDAILIKRGVPFPIAIIVAGLVTAAVGFVIGLPALRMAGIYLAIATMAFAKLVEQVIIHWEGFTGGFNGFAVDPPVLLGLPVDQPGGFYYLCLAVLLMTLIVAINLLRSPTGRAWIAIRDSEIAAQSIGVNIAYYKCLAFTFSSFIAGIAGALLAHKVTFLAPDMFTIVMSIQFLLLVVVGGLGSLQGAIFGAIFVSALPTVIAITRDHLPDSLAHQPGLQPGIFGLVLVLFILFEPGGIYGRWCKIKDFIFDFPLSKRGASRSQRSYARTERT